TLTENNTTEHEYDAASPIYDKITITTHNVQGLNTRLKTQLWFV
ncbi:6763_t:CDS:1, partial [Racocetra fulgida]